MSENETGPTVPCPTCRKPVVYSTENPWRPFCSERCRLVDLGAWADEEHRIAGEPAPPPPDDDPEAY
ncbi:hypothetical protein SAMN05660831_01248 [Thiohalospira halophila DSM 15071]|jgi:endogenous inhibitor of DNA gyrase (YacG/DUF329 family)|uniref:DNA gyrase inhibitor YacG n=1 Tax=Thiohalospira halophila DSM 15071 TaxID=1123397 RepID=A0A1I1QRJ2_9GAMM|nr:DNA gyrase inhibitor YacG [Thiohalospira halophila]SFD24679.1 hypothetical protein SAMN05660831_01248 [Thiohalospira halophila DSM 15071]